MRKLLILGLCGATQLLSGCSGDHVPFVYRLDIPQGNIVTQDMLDRLEPGMSKQQVSHVMGTPLIVDTFHPDQWVYAYRLRTGEGEVEERRIEVFFRDDRLARVTGDVKPGAGERPAGAATPASVEVPLEPAEEPGWWDRVKRAVGLGDEE